MNKILKWTLVIAVILFLFIGGVFYLQHKLITPASIKQRITQAVTKQTGRQLRINGPMHLQIIPWPKVTLSGLTLSNPAGFSGQHDFANIQHLSVSIAFWPLLRGQVRFKHIKIQGANIQLLRLASGQDNWSSSQPQTRGTTTTPSNTTAAAPNASNKATTLLAQLPDIQIVNSQISLKDQQQTLALQPFNLRIGSSGSSKKIDLSAVIQRDHPMLHMPIHLQGKLRSDGDVVAISDFKLSGTLQRRINNKIVSLPFDFKSDANYRIHQQQLQAKTVDIQLGQLHLKASVSGQSLLSSPQLQGHISIPAFDAAPLLKQWSPEWKAPAQQKMTLAFNSQYHASKQSIQLDQLQATLGKGTIKGYFHASKQPQAHFNFNIQASRLDLDPWMLPAPTPATAKTKTAASTPSLASGNAVTLHAPASKRAWNKLNGQGQLSIQQLTVAHTTLSNIHLKMTASHGILKASPIDAQLYQGHLNAGLSMNFPHNSLSCSGHIDQVNMAAWIKQLSGKSWLSGTGEGKFNINSAIFNPREHLDQMNGQGYLRVDNGDVNASDQIKTVNTLSQQHQLGAINPDNGKAAFNTFYTHFTINHGVINSDAIQLDSNSLHVQGKGVMSLAANDYKYHIQILKGHANTPIPLIISGQLKAGSKPAIQPDLVQLGQLLLKKQLQKKNGKLFQGDIGKAINKGLENLFKQ